MEYNSSIFLTKDLAAVSEHHTVYIYDTKTNKLIQNYKFTEEKITSCIIKSDSSNEDKIILLLTDNFGYLHLYDLLKRQKISKTKIHDNEIIQSKISKKRNIIYTLDVEGILKITNFGNDSLLITEKTLILKQLKKSSGVNSQNPSQKHTHNHSQINDRISYFDLDKKEKDLVFNQGLKIKILNLEKKTLKTVGAHSSQISYLTFSSDSKFITSSTEKDYFVYLWDWKMPEAVAGKKSLPASPALSLQVNSLTSRTIVRKIPNAEGVYHALSYNMEYAYGHLINLEKSSSAKSHSHSHKPLVRSFQLHSLEKNLINVDFVNSNEDLIADRNTPMNISIIYGNTFIQTNVIIKEVKYAKNFQNFIEDEVALSPVKTEINSRSESTRNQKPDQGKVILNRNFSVLNEIEMNENNTEDVSSGYMNSGERPDNMNVEISTNSVSTLDEKISLINLIKNSIINNDIATLEWTLDQKDLTIIETTVRKMTTNIIKLFIAKLIDLFQSNRLTKSKSNFLIWIELLFKYHSVQILQMPAEIINTLKKVKSIVNSRTKSLERLIEVNQKFEGILKEINFDSNGKERTARNNEFLVYEPLLIYHESDSEDEIKMKNKIVIESEKKGLSLTKEKEFVRKKKEFSENAGDVDMFVEDNAFEDDAMMEDLDRLEEEGKEDNEHEDDVEDNDEDFEDDD